MSSLPVGSIVATASRVWIKRESRDNPASPFYETWWIEATLYSIPVDERSIGEMVQSGAARVLRMGDGS